jgi:Voltage-dependent anion channel
MIFLFTMYPISLYRVAFTPKIAAPVCFIQLSAPSITMYVMTIMAQPSSRQREEQLEASPTLMQHYYELHHDLYLPIQHFMMILSLIAMVSVVQSLYARWPKFSKHEFSPAHVAFVFPLLSHTNAVQAYRSGINAFSTFPNGGSFKIALYAYWCVCLFAGSIMNLIFTYKYVKCLPKWTKISISDEEPPVAPNETMVHEMLVESNVHETMTSQFVSPAVLQANEAGQLMRVRRGTADWMEHGPYVRTRRVTAVGFDLIMSEMELRQERANLLQWVATNKPRCRTRTLSIPMMMRLSSKYDGRDIYGTFGDDVAVALLEQRKGGGGGGGRESANNNPL